MQCFIIVFRVVDKCQVTFFNHMDLVHAFDQVVWITDIFCAQETCQVP